MLAEKTVNEWLRRPVLAEDEFLDEIQKFLKARIPPLEVPDTADEWLAESAELRRRILEKVIFRGVPAEWFENEPEMVWCDTIETDKGYKIRKLRYEALPGLWIPALLYEPVEIDEKTPAILNVNGHVGPPGKTIEYEQIRCINLAKRGMLALHPEWLVFGELQGDDYKHNRQAYLDLCGTCGVSVFYLAMKRGIDVLLKHPMTDPDRVAMTGLSGGGWQTIILSSLDTRISATAPNAGYIGLDYRADFREDIGDLEQNPNDLLTIADYTHLTAMLAPRPALLIYNEKDDCCFKSYRARLSVYEPVIPFYQLFGRADDFSFHENKDPGTHNYDLDNRQQFYRFINRYFLPGSEWKCNEIPSDDEVLEYEKLEAGLPDKNANFFTLASDLMADLPESDLQNGADRLRDVLRLKSLSVNASVMAEDSDGDVNAVWYRISTDDGWTIPAVVISRTDSQPDSVALIFADDGKKILAEQVKKLVDNGVKVVALDAAFIGECVPGSHPPWQYAQMVSAVGERSLGVQVAQISGIVDWMCGEPGVEKVSLHSNGWNAGIIALSVCALNTVKISKVSMTDALTSLKKLVEDHTEYEDHPALFCFGLLKHFDVPELKKLCSPVEVEMEVTSE